MNVIFKNGFLTYLFLVAIITLGTIKGISQGHQTDFDAFLDESGLRAQLLELPLILLEQFEEESSYFDENTKQKIRQSISRTFSEELIVKDALEFLEMVNDSVHMKTVREWLNSPLTIKMNEFEQNANSPEFESEREQFLTKLQTTPPDRNRVDVILEFDELTDATYNTVKIITDLYMALIKTMNPHQTTEQRLDLNDTSEIRQSIMMQLLPVYENVTVAMNLFAYRDVKDDELDEYISFYKTDSGQWFVDVSYSIFDFVIEKVTQRIEAESK
jgi:hypothetical protein